MSKVLVNETSLSGIANAIREKNGETTTYMPSEMAAAISALASGGGGGYSEETVKALMDRSITEFEFPEGTTVIGISFFNDCTKLTLPNGLPDTLTTIGGSAFYNCYNLELSELPQSLTTIGSHAFLNCYKITISSIPSGVSVIEENTFRQCNAITEMTLHEGITTVKNLAFYNCPNLTRITFLGKPTTITGSQIFSNCPKLKDIYVPWAEGEVANAPWGATNATIHYNYEGATE